MTEFCSMTKQDAIALQAMMQKEDPAYMLHFNAFNTSGELLRQSDAAQNDVYKSLFFRKNLAGFYCLRGLDAGYVKPSFGIYVASLYKGRGLAGEALTHALQWCHKQTIEIIMLKVSSENKIAWKLYHDAGFKVTGICDDTDHIVMEKGLN